MKHVGTLCQTLLAPARLRTALAEIGKNELFGSQSFLFRAGDENAGVYLVCSGQVWLEVPGLPHLTRTFSAGSLLGLPSTFSEKPYSLTAVAAAECDIVHVSNRRFLDLMKAQPDLCRQATDILTSEIAFIFSALREQARSPAGDTGTIRSGSRVRKQVLSK